MAQKATPPAHPPPWLASRANLALIIAVLILVLAGVAAFLSYRHYHETLQHTMRDDRRVARLYALIVDMHLHDITSTLESYANRPLLIRAAEEKSTAKAQAHLLNLTRLNPAIDSVVIADRAGTLWLARPDRPEVIGKNFAHRDWHRGVSQTWTPYVSDAVLRVVEEKDAAIQIAVPIRNKKDEVIGILLNTQRAVELAKIISRVSLEEGHSVSVADRKGTIIYSSRYPYEKALVRYPFSDAFKTAENMTAYVQDPHTGGTIRYISQAPVPGAGWRVFVGRDNSSVISESAAYIRQIVAIAVLLFICVLLMLLYIRKRVLLQIAEESLRSEEDLLAGETRFRELFDHMSSGVAIYEAVRDGEDFIFSDMNHAAIRITGFHEDYRGRSVRDVFPGVVEFGLFRVFQQVWRTGRAEFHPTSMYTDRHLAFWAENYVYKLPSGQIVAVFDDVTESKRAEEALKESEKKLREAQEMAHLGFWTWDVKTGRVEWSGEVFKIFGLSPRTFKPQIDSIMDLSPWPEDHERDRELIRRAMENHAPGSYEQKFLRPDQSVGYYYSTFQGQYDEQGNLVSIVGTVLDITERKQTEESIHKLNEELEQKVERRTAELAAKNAELERLNRVFVDREIRMKELKARIAELERK